MLLKVPGSGDVPTPLIVPTDAGNFAKALTKVAPGKNLLAFGDLLLWSDYVKLWSKITGVPASFEKSTVKALDEIAPGGYGEEIGEMVSCKNLCPSGYLIWTMSDQVGYSMRMHKTLDTGVETLLSYMQKM